MSGAEAVGAGHAPAGRAGDGAQSWLGKKRTRGVGESAGEEEPTKVHSLMQACATAFAGLRAPLKQMVASKLLLAPVLDALDGLTEEDLGLCRHDLNSMRGHTIEVFAGPDFAVDVMLLPGGAHLPIVDPREELGVCKVVAGSVSVRRLAKVLSSQRRRGRGVGEGARGSWAPEGAPGPVALVVKGDPEEWGAQCRAQLLCDGSATSTVLVAIAAPASAVVVLVRAAANGQGLALWRRAGRGGALGSLSFVGPAAPTERGGEEEKGGEGAGGGGGAAAAAPAANNAAVGDAGHGREGEEVLAGEDNTHGTTTNANESAFVAGAGAGVRLLKAPVSTQVTLYGEDRGVGAGEGGGGGADGGLRVQEYRGVGWGPLVVGTTIVCCMLRHWPRTHR